MRCSGAGVLVWGPGRDAGDAHLPHVPLHGFSIDQQPLPPQLGGQAPAAVEGMRRVEPGLMREWELVAPR